MLYSNPFRAFLLLTISGALACQSDSENDNYDTAIAPNGDTVDSQESDSATNLDSDTATEDTATDPEDTAADSEETGSPLNLSAGCGASTNGLGTNILIEGETRTYVLSLPDDYDTQTAYPLIFAWHGRGGSGNVAKGYFGLQDVAGSEAIIVYPNGLPQELYNGDTGWEVRTAGSDIVFFDELYDRITENACIDLNRVFSAGHSFGGFMTNFLGCQRGTVLNSIAVVAGGGPWGSCQGSVAALLIHGSNDNIVEFSEGESSLVKWQAKNDCSESSVSSSEGYCVAYDNCTQPVEWCEFEGGHIWPDFAEQTIWDFFLSR